MKQILDDYRIKIAKLSGRIEQERQRAKSIKDEHDSLVKDNKITLSAIELAKRCVENSLELRKHIETIISEGLTDVFGEKYTFILEPIKDDDGIVKGLKPRLSAEGGDLDDPLNSFGAGVAAIASVCFRIAVLLLTPGTIKLIIFDEPLANLSPALQGRFQAFIENICKETGLQLVMITHMDDPFGRVWEVTKTKKGKKGVSSVQEVLKNE